MRRTVPIILALTLALAGCAAGDTADEPDGTPSATPDPTPSDAPSPTPDDDPTATPSASPGDDVASMAFDVCTTDRFSIGHPADWATNEPDLVDQCRVFHPDPIDLPDRPQEIGLHWAVTVFVDAVVFNDVSGQSATGEVLEERSTTVDGRDAVVTEVRADGVGLLPEGERQYLYAVDLDGETLFARTTTVGETDYDRDRRVLDRMMDELAITPIEPLAGPATTDPQSAEHDGDPIVLTDIQVASFASFDRLTLTIGGDGEAGWDVAYEEDPRSQGSGTPVEVAGDATLRLTLTGAALPPDAPVAPYDGPERLTPSATDAIREVLDDTMFEGRHELFVGLDRERPFRIGRRDGAVVLDVPFG